MAAVFHVRKKPALIGLNIGIKSAFFATGDAFVVDICGDGASNE